MAKLDPQGDGGSPSQIERNVQHLKNLFPEIVTDGKVDFLVLRQVLGDYVADTPERYCLNWNGKRLARRIAQSPSTATLRPCPDESLNWESTQHLFIEGDNLEVLKLLQKSYYHRVKLIYIDPPYNTGNEFIYRDKYADNLSTYLRYTQQTNESGDRHSVNSETSGRFHTNWLNMIYPRLCLARNLLTDDGFIVVSIDDTELPNLSKVLQEIFGEENMLATLVWDRNRKNDANFFSVGHEYMIVCAKNKGHLRKNDTQLRVTKPGLDEVRQRFDELRNRHGDNWTRVASEVCASCIDHGKVTIRGNHSPDSQRSINMARIATTETSIGRAVVGHVTKFFTRRPVNRANSPRSGWRYPTPKRFWEEVEAGRIAFGPDETTIPRVRTNLFEHGGEVMHSVHYSYAQTATNAFNLIFDGQRVFDNPKHFEDLRSLVAYLTGPDDIVLDFFAGSCTTAHAVLLQNRQGRWKS